MDLIEVINQIIQNNTEAQKLTDLAIGTVTSASPLKIQINPNMPPLPAEVLLLTDSVKEHTEPVYSLSTPKTQIGNVELPGLSINDKVIMLRVMGGQQFIVLSRI